MAVTFANLTVNPQTLVDADPTSDFRITVRTNASGAVIDDAAKKIFLGSYAVQTKTNATISLPLTNGATNPTDYQYTVDLSYIDAGTRERTSWNSGWFSFTAAADLSEIVAEQYVPPTWMTTAVAILQGYVDDAGAYANAFTAGAVETLDPGEPATAEIIDGVLYLGIPAGDITPAAQAAIDAAVIAAAAAAAGPAAAAATALAAGYADDAADSAAIALAALGEWAETPTLINPPSPTWNDATSQFTVPSGVVGADYAVVSGGGLTPGTIFTPGTTVSTTGTFPRTVILEPLEQSGYVLATSGMTFHHDFPDPAAMVVLTSDGFSGANTASIGGRAMDLAAGGSATNWPAGAYFGITSTAAVTTTTAGAYVFTYPSVENLKIEANISAMSPSGAAKYQLAMNVRGFGLLIGAASLRLQGPSSTSNGDLIGSSGDFTAQPTGTWSMQIYGTTLTITKGNGAQLVYDLNQPQGVANGSGARFQFSGVFTDHSVSLTNSYTLADSDTATLDNFKITKVGF